MSDKTKWATTVIDAGARYGMHPSWRGFRAPLGYFAFEPDKTEADQLRASKDNAQVEIIDNALGRVRGKRELHILRHRGQSSMLEPDPESFWFKDYRKGEGEVVDRVLVDCDTIDKFSCEKDIGIDFLKLDTEGTEFEILQGATEQLEKNILGIRSEVNFQREYKNQPLFGDIHAILLESGFFLMNMDYFGRGVPRNPFYRNPDPLSADDAEILLFLLFKQRS